MTTKTTTDDSNVHANDDSCDCEPPGAVEKTFWRLREAGSEFCWLQYPAGDGQAGK